MEQDSEKTKTPLALLVSFAIALAIEAKAENQILRQRLRDEHIEIDQADFDAALTVNRVGVSEDLRKRYPQFANVLPHTEQLLRKGFLSLDR